MYSKGRQPTDLSSIPLRVDVLIFIFILHQEHVDQSWNQEILLHYKLHLSLKKHQQRYRNSYFKAPTIHQDVKKNPFFSRSYETIKTIPKKRIIIFSNNTSNLLECWPVHTNRPTAMMRVFDTGWVEILISVMHFFHIFTMSMASVDLLRIYFSCPVDKRRCW